MWEERSSVGGRRQCGRREVVWEEGGSVGGGR